MFCKKIPFISFCEAQFQVIGIQVTKHYSGVIENFSRAQSCVQYCKLIAGLVLALHKEVNFVFLTKQYMLAMNLNLFVSYFWVFSEVGGGNNI